MISSQIQDGETFGIYSCPTASKRYPSDAGIMSLSETEEKNAVVVEFSRDVEREVVVGIYANVIIWPIAAALFCYLAYTLNTTGLPHVFIDEKFHVDQTLRYLRGEWSSWNGKITTPPGLYLLGWLQYHATRFVTNWSTLTALRLTNLIGGVIVWPWVVLRPLYLFNALGFWPVTLMCFPLMASYYFLYYTDIWSTIFIVESLNLALVLPFGETASIWMSALCGLISCLFRQTNIVWNVLIMILVVERRAMIEKNFNTLNFNNYLKLVLHTLENFKSLILPYAINFVLFLAFLLYNRSITLGDKSNHVAGLHIVQFFYCLMFIAFFSVPVWFSKQVTLSYLIRFVMNPVKYLLELLGIMLIIRYFTVVHPFLLADNRHITFYLFKKLIGRTNLFKYCVMAPIYHFSTYVYLEVMRPSTMIFHPILPIEIKNPIDLPIQLTHISWTALIMCTFMTVVPSPLFEPRYYILPFIFWRLFITMAPEPFWGNPMGKVTGTKRHLSECAWFMIINLITYIIFKRIDIKWESETTVQHIIW
ncbi:Die2 [Kluyveromyces lactis]|nr:Die2 [Kluyveromyces lactis]